MTTLRQALQQQPVHFIAIIGRENGLGIDSNLVKADLIDKVAARLADPAQLAARLERLSAPQQEALHDLLLAGPRLPARYLARSHGSLRSTRQIIRAYRQQAGLSPLEQLCVRGLIFFDRRTQELFVPADIRPHLPDPQPPAPLPAPPGPAPAPFDLLRHDLTGLLALLQTQAVTLIHGHWLPPHFLKLWGQHCAAPPATAAPRSELQTGRRRFIHYLAESAGLVGPQPAPNRPAAVQLPQPDITHPRQPAAGLVPGPAAWQWLAAPRRQQLDTLWRAWLAADPERWRRYRLPGHTWQTDPAVLLPSVHQALLEIDAADPAQFARWLIKQQPHLLSLIPANSIQPQARLAKTIQQLLTGPLRWLGLLVQVDGAAGAADSPKTALSLHPAGRAWLTGQPLPPSTPATYTITPNFQPDPLAASLTLTPAPAGGLPQPSDLMAALELGELDQTGSNQGTVRLTAPACIAAIHRGWSPPALRQTLARLAGRDLTGPELNLLRRWAEGAGRMRLHLAWLLESSDPQVISRLAASRRGRALIQGTFSPRAVAVDPTRLDVLIRRLTGQEGVPPQVGAPRPPAEGSRLASITPHAAGLWLAVQVYQRLGQIIPLPARLPQALLDDLAAGLSDVDAAAAETLADQTLAALAQALDGRAAFPPWIDDGQPVADSQTLIRQAMARGQDLRLHYYSVSSDSLKWRTVEPYRLEQRGNTPYLVGFCQHAQAERTFRLDRIKQLELVERDGIDSGWEWG